MTPKALREEILRLSADERLALVGDIWDSLAASPDQVDVPQSHRTELDRRLADPAEQATLSWEDVQRRLRK